MARTGRPKSDNPMDRKISIRFTEEEYEILLEYAKNHELSITQAIKMSVKLNILSAQKQCRLSIPREEEKMAARKDGKGRALRAGEQYRKSEGRGRYSYCYTDPFGKRNYIYSTNLATLRDRADMFINNQRDG